MGRNKIVELGRDLQKKTTVKEEHERRGRKIAGSETESREEKNARTTLRRAPVT